MDTTRKERVQSLWRAGLCTAAPIRILGLLGGGGMSDLWAGEHQAHAGDHTSKLTNEWQTLQAGITTWRRHRQLKRQRKERSLKSIDGNAHTVWLTDDLWERQCKKTSVNTYHQRWVRTIKNENGRVCFQAIIHSMCDTVCVCETACVLSKLRFALDISQTCHRNAARNAVSSPSYHD